MSINFSDGMAGVSRERPTGLFGQGGGGGGGSTFLGAPILSSPNAGTPTTDGSTGQSVVTDQGSGTLYWGVVTNGGTATDAQLKAGTGGNLVGTAGNRGSLTVNASGTQSPGTITGLTTATTYQILYLHTNALSKDSAQVSVSLTTA